MGEAQLRKEYEAQKVLFDFLAVKCLVGDRDRETWGAGFHMRAIKTTMDILAAAAYPQGMADESEAADIWEVWQGFINDPDCANQITIGMREVIWMKKLAERMDLRVPIFAVQWRRALARYLTTVQPEKKIVTSPKEQQ